MPEMPPVSTHAECAPMKSMPDVYGGSTSSHDPRAGSVPSPEMSATKVSATKVSATAMSATNVAATKVAATMTTAMSATMTTMTTAVSRGSIGGER
jgi:hypothetical protein